MTRYLCSLPNIKGEGRMYELYSDDPAEIEAFVNRHDVPGRAVYACINPLKPGSRRRCLETVARIERLPFDIDHRDLEESPEQVDAKLQQLMVEPTEVRDSGGGRHVDYVLREPIDAEEDPEMFERACRLMKTHAASLSADPAPTHPAALLRVIGSHNTKRGEPVEVRPLWGSGLPVDITDLEAQVDLLPETGIFTRKAPTNGAGCTQSHGPVDVSARLSAMRFGGAGDNALRASQLSCTASMLRDGVGFVEVVNTVFEATKLAVADDPRANRWNWVKELNDIGRMCSDFLVKNRELLCCLSSPLREAFEQALIDGRNPYCVHRKDRGWWFSSARGDGPKSRAKPGASSQSARAGSGDGAPYPDLGLYMFKPIDEASLPPRAWLYGRHYQRRTVSVTASPGGTGKTSLVMVEGVAMATARDLLGEQPTARLRIWYHNGEDSREELNRRLVAICRHYEIPQHELTGQLVLTSGNEFPLRVAKGYSDLKIDTPLVNHIREQIAKHQIDVAILDPLITLHNVSESDNNRMDTVVRIFAGIADEQNCTFELEHHMRKLRAGDTDFDGADARGASSIHDAVRALRVLNRMSVDDATQLAIPEHERAQYFRVDKAKGNNARASQAVWRRFVNVDLANSDEVGVVVPYTLPGQGERTEAMAAAEATADRIFLELLARLTLAGISVNDKPRGHYAPRVFAKEPEAKLARVGIAAFEDAMRRLIKSARVRVAHTTLRGRETSYLEVV